MAKSQLSDRSHVLSAPHRPVCDEWGVYDPEQAGFEAVLRRLVPEDGEDAGISVARPPSKPVRSR